MARDSFTINTLKINKSYVIQIGRVMKIKNIHNIFPALNLLSTIVNSEQRAPPLVRNNRQKPSKYFTFKNNENIVLTHNILLNNLDLFLYTT